MRRALALLTVPIALAALGVLTLTRHGNHGNQRSTTRPADSLAGLSALPLSPKPALRIEAPQPLRATRYLSRWTIVLRPSLARVAPAAQAAVVTRLGRKAPEGTANALAVLATRTDAAGRLWVAVRLPVLPNGRVGWVPRSALGAYELVRTHLQVDEATLRATLYRNGRPIFRAPVSIGAAKTPTPTGTFLVRSKLTRYQSPFYGPLAFGTTARSAVLTDWPAGGFVGIHGTNEPHLVPGRISHGCIRMRNRDILRLAKLMPIGTPLTIISGTVKLVEPDEK
jgi:hypothetical protein